MKKIALLLLCISLLMGCVPTPEEEIVKNKADGKLEETLTVTAAPLEADAPHETFAERLGAPERWTEDEIQKKVPYGTLTLCIDAEVHIPDVEKVGVYTATMDPPFSEAQQKALIRRYFGENAPLFRCYRAQQCKWTYEDSLKRLQAEIVEIEANKDDPYREELLENRNDILELVMEQYRNAPDDYEHREWDGVYASGHGPNRTALSVDTDTDVPAHYRTLKLESYQFSYNDESLESGVETRDTGYHWPARIIEPQTEWERKAAEMALSEIAALGIGDFTVKEVLTNYASPNGKNNDAPGAVVTLLPMTDGLPTYSFRTWHGNDNAVQRAKEEGLLESEYNIELRQCSASIGFHDSTVSFLSIGYPGTVTGCVNDNVQLLPFSEIRKIFLEQAPLHYFIGDPDQPDESGSHVYVTDVYLSMMRVRKKDSDELYLLPVWDFGFYELNEYHTAEDAEKEKDFFSFASLLTINALDGTIIDRERGY